MTKAVPYMNLNKSMSKHIITIPLLTLLFIALFFFSTLKVKIIYSPSAVEACPADASNTCHTYQQSMADMESHTNDQLAADSVVINKVTHDIIPKPTSYPFTIVTASSANHLCSLENFLYSLNTLRPELTVDEFPRIVVYNIGMNRTQLPILDQLVENGLIDDLEVFDYFKYPRFWDVAINAGEYGWKTGIVHEASIKYTQSSNGILVWLDAGNVVTAEFIRTIPNIIRQNNGFWSPYSSNTMDYWTHPGLYEYYNANPEEYAKNPNCNGASIGFDVFNQTIINTIINPWFECGLNKNCIAPPGSSRANHRQDQAALTFLAYRAGQKCRKVPSFYNFQTHRDKSCRSELMALDLQGKLHRPSSLDEPTWYASNTLQLYHHPEWRYPADKVPENISRFIGPASDYN